MTTSELAMQAAREALADAGLIDPRDVGGDYAMGMADDEATAPPRQDSPLAKAMREARARINNRRIKSDDEIPVGGYNASDLINEQMTDIEWIVRPILQVEAVGLVGGKYKGCKSWCSCSLALSISMGVPFLRRFPVMRRGWVLYIAFEDSKRNIRSRLRALAIGEGLDPAVALARIQVIPRPRSINLMTPAGQDWVIAQATAVERRARDAGSQLELVVLDPFGNIHAAKNENDAAEVLPIMNALKLLRDTMGCSFTTPHHMGKGKGTPGAPVALEDRLRGSSAIFQAVDQWILIDQKDEEESEAHRHWNLHVVAGTREGGGTRLDIELDLRLHDNGTASTAAFAPIDARKGDSSVEEKSPEDRIVEFLKSKRVPQSQNKIAAGAHVKKQNVPALLLKLIRGDRIEEGDRGFYIPMHSQDSNDD